MTESFVAKARARSSNNNDGPKQQTSSGGGARDRPGANAGEVEKLINQLARGEWAITRVPRSKVKRDGWGA